MLADLLETVANRFPSMRHWSVADEISTRAAGSPRMVTVLTRNVAGPKQAQSAAVRRHVKGVVRWTDGFRIETLGLLQQLGIGSTDSATDVGADLQPGRKKHEHVARTRLRTVGLRARRVRPLRKAGACKQNNAISGPKSSVLWGSAIQDFKPTQLKSVRVNAAQAAFRFSWAKMLTSPCSPRQGRRSTLLSVWRLSTFGCGSSPCMPGFGSDLAILGARATHH